MRNNKLNYALMIYIILMLIIPNSFDTIFGIIPVRLLLTLIIDFVLIVKRFHNREKFKILSKPIMLLIFLLLIFMAISTLKSYSFVTSIYTILKFVLIFILGYLVWLENFDNKTKKNLVLTYMVSSLLVFVYGILNYIFRLNLDPKGVYKYAGAIGRVYSTFENANYFGLFAVISLVFFLYLFLENKYETKKEKYLLSSLLLLNMVCICLTFSRSIYALFGLMLFLIFLVNIRSIKNNYKKLLFIVIVCFGLLAIPGVISLIRTTAIEFLPQKVLNILNINQDDVSELSFNSLDNYQIIENKDSYYTGDDNLKKENIVIIVDGDYMEVTKVTEKIRDENGEEIIKETYYSKSDGSTVTRKQFTQLVKKVIKNNKLFGVGIGAYKQFFNDSSNAEYYLNGKFGYPHNFYNHLWAESGIFSLIIVIILLSVSLIYFAIKLFQTKNKVYYYVLCIFACINIMCFFESVYYDSQVFPIYIIVLLLLVKFDTKTSKRVMFISSVGGHLTQLLSLKSMFNNYSYLLVTEKNDVTLPLKEKYKIKYLLYGSRKYKFSYPFIALYNIFKSIYLYLIFSPDVIVTTGTHTAVPMCYLGWLGSKKVIFVESFSKSNSPTLSGRLVYLVASTFVVQWESMLKFYPKAKYWGGIY